MLIRVILKTEYGDCNLDGRVDIVDLNALAANWGAIGCTSWAEGDFNGDHAADILDLNEMAAHWGYPRPPGIFEDALAGTGVPEPATMAMLAAGAAGLLMRRRGRRGA